MAIRIIFLLFTLSISLQLSAQKDDPVLFTVNETPVHLSEFEYIYTKTNGTDADYSEASLDEYLNLYVNFKLKVEKAKEMRLDTIQSLQQELEGYRRQLADSYLIDREVTEKLVREAYERVKQDVDLSHILVLIPENASPADTLKAWNKIVEAKEKIDKGEPFEAVAKAYSEDKSVTKNQGHIGYVTALFPNGFYALETAAYNAPLGKTVGPVRTTAGYHLLKVHKRRPARGEIEVAHILVRMDKNPDLIKARKKIDEVYAKLQEGEDFNELAREYSDDKVTANKGGYLGFFGINRYEQEFEEAAFALENDGDITKPVKTSIGWHVIKRISRKNDESYPQAKARLQNKIKQDARFELARLAMIERIKKEAGYSENPATLKAFINSLEQDSAKTFLTYKWKAPEEPSKQVLFAFGKDMQVTLGEFENYLQRASRKRQQMARQGIATVVNHLYEDFVGDYALKFEEQKLEEKYPEFKSLMREYEEGVLLFEVTKMLVWDKASQDTVGLQAFYDRNKEKYQWDERAVVSEYTLVDRKKEQINQLREFVQSNDPETVLEKFNGNDPQKIVTVRSRTYERGRNEMLDKMKWKPGELSAVEINRRDKSLSFFKIEEILPPGQKTLQDARGYVVADYQDYLEAQWLASLKSEYDVDVNNRIYNKLIRKGEKK